MKLKYNYRSVGERGLEPPASASQKQRSSQLSYSPCAIFYQMDLHQPKPKDILPRMQQEARPFFPTTKVENEVVWVNNQITSPLDLTIMQSSSLGVFLVGSDSSKVSDISLAVETAHGRSGYLGKYDVVDKKGIKFPHVDLKGTGYIKSYKREDPESKAYDYEPRVEIIGRKDENSTYGIWRRDKAEREITITENINNEGIRTNRIMGLIKINEVSLPDGQIITIEQAKKAGLIHPFEEPVIGVRAYRFRERIQHCYRHSEEFITQAKDEVSQELGRELSWQEYLVWFSETLGQNLAMLHEADYYHGAPEEHNITLAAEIVDFGLGEPTNTKRLNNNAEGTVETLTWFDYKLTRDCVGRMVGNIQWDLDKRSELIPGTHFGEIYRKSYESNNTRYNVTEREYGSEFKVDFKRKRKTFGLLGK